MELTKSRAATELVLAGILWGFGFVATVWALQSVSPSVSMLIRFGVSFVLGELIAVYILKKTWSFDYVKLSFISGSFLGLTLLLQTIGLQYTSATNSGFITTLYVVLVPLFGSFFLRHRFHWLQILCTATALIGTGLMVNLHQLLFNIGDLYTFICAITAAVQILYIGQIAPKIQDSFRFNNFQSFWSFLLALIFVPFDHMPFRASFDKYSIFGLISLTLGSTLLAFYLQVRAQKVLSASTCSLLLLLESPFACLFAILLLHESMSLSQGIGAFLILSSAMISVWVEK